MRHLVLPVAFLSVAAALVAAAPLALDVRATLTGEVLPEGLVRPGQVVRDGEPLLYVRALLGRAVAARAPDDGTVLEVLVRPGQLIREKGAIVARIVPR